MSVNIDCPLLNGTGNVVLVGTGTTGYISASGSATGDGGGDDDDGSQALLAQNMLAEPYESVCGRVYVGVKTSASPDVPETAPTDAVCVQNPSDTDDIWYIPNVPGAVCSAAPGTVCTLVIWANFTNELDTQRGFRTFNAVCAAATNCPAPEGWPPPPNPILARSQMLMTVPHFWRVSASGFTGPGGEAFNNDWNLELRGATAGMCSWDNGGDGASAVRVRLSCESPVASLWRLDFHLGGQFIAYRLSAASWKPLASNVLALSARDTTGECVPPPVLSVTPG